MRRIMVFGLVAWCAAAAASVASAQVPKPNSAPPQEAPNPVAKLQTQTRLITVDVVASDSHGKPIRGLTQNDFQISEEHSGPQKIAKFRFVDASAATSTPAIPAAASGLHVYSNQAFDKLKVPPSILLMDALNTDTDQQAQVHRHMLMVLKTLPSNTPIAVFVLGHSLSQLQGFTTDPALLKAAVDRTIRPTDIEQDPQSDPNNVSNSELAENGGEENTQIQSLEDFEATAFEEQMSIRVDETTDAMVAIAKYLGGYPGRKNLLWFSEAFPNWIAPSTDFGTDAFRGSATYSDKIRQAFEALTDAQVAVYPVDARGLETSQLFSASQNPPISGPNSGNRLARLQDREETMRFAAQGTMEQIAQETGGKMCENTNDLSGCVQSALDDSSVYYELAYYPENSSWDGKFHKITVKSSAHGTKLRHRSGYFATDAATLAKRQTPDKLLQQACAGPLPATTIPLTVVPLPWREGEAKAANGASQNRYLLTIATSALTMASEADARQLNLQMAVCEYLPKSESFAFFPRDLSRSVPDALFADWQANGVRNIFDYDAKPESQRLRFAVLDVSSGATGSVDAPAHPAEFAPPSRAVSGVSDGTPAPVRIPFKASGGAASALDWSGASVSYQGNINVQQGAQAFFKAAYGARYRCDGGKLVSDANPAEISPVLSLTFRNPNGHAAFVELGAEAPVYTGDMPVDASAKPFFDSLWKLTHGQLP